MYELVHTSAANGLIAGTHGYAPVEMTRTMPDGLRNRVEVFCGYAHCAGANPVNWFHAILEKGEHVVGRVVACEKDYTGRTNRLAKVRVWSAAEIPRCGAAELLATGGEWFRAAWDGEVKYLDEAKGSAWARVFGARGDELCQRVAWQVERNLETGRTLYFRTSVEWDCEGEKLLELFGEVIDALPEEVRRRVTFATYPAAMPSGGTCHLRGRFDEVEDAGFERAKGLSVWVDCVEGRVEHEELLPREGLKKADESAARCEAMEDELETARKEAEELKARLMTEQRAAEFARAYAKKLQDEKAQVADGSQATWLKMQAKLEGELARARGWCWAFAILSVVLILIGVGIYWGAAKVESAGKGEEAAPVVEEKEETPVAVDGARAPSPLCNGPAERPMAKRGTGKEVPREEKKVVKVVAPVVEEAQEEKVERPRLSIRSAAEVPRKKLNVKTIGEGLFQSEAKDK